MAEDVKFSHLIKYLSKVETATANKYLLKLLAERIIGKREYNYILKAITVIKNTNLGL